MATKSTSAKKTTSGGFTEAERAAMKERAEELKSSGKGGAKKADDLQNLLDKIAEMDDADRTLAERIHSIVSSAAPDLDAKTWYGMPAYGRNGKAIVFFKPAAKFGARYATLGFNDGAQLDDGEMWPTEYAVTTMSDAVAKRIEQLVKTAAG